VLAIVLAYPLAFFVARQKPSARTYWFAIVLIPFWTNYLVRILSFMDFLRSEPFGWSGLYQMSGIVAAMTYNAIPVAFLPLYAALEKIEPVLFDAARDLGSGSWSVFREVIWPLSSTGRKSAFFLVFIPGLGEFLIPELVGGGRTFVLGNFLQNQFLSARNWPLGASAVSLVFLFTIIGAMAIHSLQKLPNKLPKRKGISG
jgi:ABC-type spermidine/putrescine transport system permease subunit I